MKPIDRRNFLALSVAGAALSLAGARAWAAPRIGIREGSLAKAWAEMRAAGVQRIQSTDLV